MLPRNKFTAFALLWLAAGIYSLVFREADGGVPPFPHFDKAAHFLLFFAQTWLWARSFIEDKRPIPYRGIVIFSLIYAVGSEYAQAAWTETREGSFADGIADLLGMSAALCLAKKWAAVKAQLQTK